MSLGDYDALIVVSFGGPEGKDDVMPFLENVLRGRNVPRERMLSVAEHYYEFGGVSSINAQNRDLINALEKELQTHEIDLPIYFGNRNWHPLLPDTVAKMKSDGVRRALAFFTSAYSCYSGCRQYRENVIAACETVGEGAPEINKLRHYFNHPGFIEAMSERVEQAKAQFSADELSSMQLAFTAHSIPMGMADSCKYVEQLTEASRLIASASDVADWKLVYQSRSGPPSQPWLEPDICDHIKHIADQGAANLIIVPVGFISDHMEVIYDLDTEAVEAADEAKIKMVRAGTAGTHPRFVSMIRELIEERASDAEEKPSLGSLGPSHDVCPVNCCPRVR